MLRHRELFDPIKRTAEIPEAVFSKYIDIADHQYHLIPIAPELTAKIKKVFYEAHRDIDKEYLDHIWQFVYERIHHNEGLAQFILDFDGAKSNYFFPWLISVFTSPSEALELGYNAGYDLEGNWDTNIPEEDEINSFVRNTPTVAYNRERQLYVADLATTDREIMSVGEKSKVLDLGAGRLAWARHHGFKFEPNLQAIEAYDIDQSINPHDLFAEKLPDLNLKYEHKDILSALRDPAVNDISLAILGGVASYYPVDKFREGIIRPIYYKLRTNGRFFFDLQLAHLAYIWSVKTFGWPEMKLPKKASDAIDIVEGIRNDLWRDGLKFGAEYVLDTYNKPPLSVMVVLTKI
ncbi:hypothetical protein IKF26_01585 [Candidatus Saccharibacteria bacterium]|nr:hypothetical protein [Candidatus Saccharibacteria bacterium]